MPYLARCRLLRDSTKSIAARLVEIAAVVSLETGKTRIESIAEVQEAIDLITTYCDVMERNNGFAQPLSSFVDGEVNTDVLRPYGVFGVISPFNFPFALTIGMTSAALIAGNTVVLKPSEDALWSAGLVAETFGAVLPRGVSTSCMVTGRREAQSSTATSTGSPSRGRRRWGGALPPG